MANYIAWYGKKRAKLAEREREFLELLRGGASGSKLEAAAEEVRAAQVRTLKSRRAELPPYERNAAAVANLDREIEFWVGLSVAEVIDGYRTGNFKGYRSPAVRRAAR